MSSLLGKIKDVVNPGAKHEDRGRDTVTSRTSAANGSERSMSRGRGLAVGTGRGGAGNMSHSQVRGGDDESPAAIEAARSRSRSRARAAHHGHDAPVGTGRGGAGNVHRDPSGSRDPARAAESRDRANKLAVEDEAMIKKYEEKHAGDTVTAGRGGFGNVKSSHGLTDHLHQHHHQANSAA